VRLALALALALLLAPSWAQAPAKKETKAAKPSPVKAQKAHRKATPEQVRRFNELQKKQDAKR
jgi:hypothetical protein